MYQFTSSDSLSIVAGSLLVLAIVIVFTARFFASKLAQAIESHGLFVARSLRDHSGALLDAAAEERRKAARCPGDSIPVHSKN